MPTGGRVDNLDPVRTKEEAKRRGSNGGKESGKKRRQNREMREILEQVLRLPIMDGRALDKLTSSGNTRGKNYTTSEAIVLAQVQAAMRGDQKALRFVLEMSGQLAKVQQEQQPDDGFMEALQGAAKGAWSEDGEIGDVPV